MLIWEGRESDKSLRMPGLSRWPMKDAYYLALRIISLHLPSSTLAQELHSWQSGLRTGFSCLIEHKYDHLFRSINRQFTSSSNRFRGQRKPQDGGQTHNELIFRLDTVFCKDGNWPVLWFDALFLTSWTKSLLIWPVNWAISLNWEGISSGLYIDIICKKTGTPVFINHNAIWRLNFRFRGREIFI